MKRTLRLILPIMVVMAFLFVINFNGITDITGNAISGSITVCKNGSCQYTTINEALEDANDYQTIKINDNAVYHENLVINKPLTIVSSPGKRPIITGVDESYLDYAVLLLDDIILDGLDIIADAGVEGGLVAQQSSNGIKLLNLVIGEGTVFNLHVNTKVALDNSVIRNAGSAGIQLGDNGIVVIDKTSIHSNIIGIKQAKKNSFVFLHNSDLYNNGVGIFQADGFSQLENSNFAYNNKHGINLAGGRIDITNSVITFNYIGIEKTGGILNSDYNNFYGNEIKTKNIDLGNNSISVNSRFINAEEGDFRIYDDSPLIGKSSTGGNIGSDQLCTADYCSGLDDIIAKAIANQSYVKNRATWVYVFLSILIVGGVFVYFKRDDIDINIAIKRVETAVENGDKKQAKKYGETIQKIYNRASPKLKKKVYPKIHNLKKHKFK